MEIWRDIVGYEDLYQVSNFGNVRSLNYRNSGVPHNLLFKRHRCGYAQILLAKDGERKMFLIHRLVASAFLDNPNNYQQVNHKDENKRNNIASNLEWCDASHNVKYSIGLHPERDCGNRTKHPYKHDNLKIAQIDADGNIVRFWGGTPEIRRDKRYNPSNIIQCCLGKRKTAHGFIWQYAI